MALSKEAFSSASSGISGAVSDLFAGFAAERTASLQAKGLNIQAESLRIKAQGDIAESQSYDLASGLARQNEQYTKESQVIQQAQLDRSIIQTQGAIQANVAGAGLKESGSALDVLADSAAQGRSPKTCSPSRA